MAEILPFGATQAAEHLDADTKLLATLRASAALFGCTLLRIDNGGRDVFVISRGALCEELDSPEEVAAWLGRCGGSGP